MIITSPKEKINKSKGKNQTAKLQRRTDQIHLTLGVHG